jgi:hydroxyethylthiazole kinase-like sugar kinase family protein
MLVNTFNGYSESIDIIPSTTRRYVTKSRIKKAKIGECDIIEGVKSEIMNFLGEKYKSNTIDKVNLQNINIKEVKSIYKPYWVANFRGRSILVDA